MKILFIARGFPSHDNPMNGNYESEQAIAMAKCGHKVYYLCRPKCKSLAHLAIPHLKTEVVSGVKIYELIGCVKPFIPGLPHFQKVEDRMLRYYIKILYEMFIKENGKPDLIHCHSLYVAAVSSFLKDKQKIPLVVTEHWSAINQDDSLPSNIFEWGNMVYRNADAVIAVSKALASKIEKHWGIKTHVVHNLVDDRFWKPVKTIKEKGRFRFIVVGRLVAIKRYDLLIKSFTKAQLPSFVTLSIVGDGEEMNKLKQLTFELKVQDRVEFMGLKNKDEVAKILAESDCFVCTSISETFGIALIEAMAKGIPVISVPCGGPEEFVTPETGIITPDDSAESVASAMRNMFYNRGRFNCEYIKEYCFKQFSREVITDEINKIYKQFSK